MINDGWFYFKFYSIYNIINNQSFDKFLISLYTIFNMIIAAYLWKLHFYMLADCCLLVHMLYSNKIRPTLHMLLLVFVFTFSTYFKPASYAHGIDEMGYS